MGIFQVFIRDGEFRYIAYAGFLVVALFAFAYHEFAHALMADRLGDDTPRNHGRITLNPFPHISLLGFILLATIGIGWATTPVNPSKLAGNPRLSHALVALVGPLANLFMALFFAAAGSVLNLAALNQPEFVESAIYWGVWLNTILLFFNLLPIPPLDGFTILLGFLPGPLAQAVAPLRRFGMLAFLLVIFLLPSIGIDVLGVVFGWAFSLTSLLLGGQTPF